MGGKGGDIKGEGRGMAVEGGDIEGDGRDIEGDGGDIEGEVRDIEGDGRYRGGEGRDRGMLKGGVGRRARCCCCRDRFVLWLLRGVMK